MNGFTREQLKDFQAVAYNHPLDGYRNTVQDLAAFALALLDRAEKAEDERGRLREELREAEEAVLFADSYIRSELADDYRIVEGDNRVWSEDFTAVRRARELAK